jgi:hypothetical protein
LRFTAETLPPEQTKTKGNIMSIIFEITNELKTNISHRRRLMPEQKKRDAQSPRSGDIAPDFTLHDITGEESITLSDFRDKKPVALIFGSFT